MGGGYEGVEGRVVGDVDGGFEAVAVEGFGGGGADGDEVVGSDAGVVTERRLSTAEGEKNVMAVPGSRVARIWRACSAASGGVIGS